LSFSAYLHGCSARSTTASTMTRYSAVRVISSEIAALQRKTPYPVNAAAFQGCCACARKLKRLWLMNSETRSASCLHGPPIFEPPEQ
jgi:hypothetical protein